MQRPAMVEVQNVNVPGSVANVNAEKYVAMRKALLKVLPKQRPGLAQTEMGAAVLPHLPPALWPNGEKAMWWVKTVQLNLEARGLVARDLTSRPLRWRRT